MTKFKQKQNNFMAEQNIFDWYQEQAKRTCPDLGSEKLNLAHMVLGLCSEEEEYVKACFMEDLINMGEEQADKMWYIANYCTFRNFNLQNLYNTRNTYSFEEWEEMGDSDFVRLSQLQDIVKKNLAYNKPLNEKEEKRIIRGMLQSIIVDCEWDAVDLFESLRRNIEKLKVRFPEKFTEENALNRNLEAERKVLEV
jgi:NTP pyrophosphatase (non-canonical NTP hydrolase)